MRCKLVPRLGLEPTSSVLSSLFIVAQSRTYLAVVIRPRLGKCDSFVAVTCSNEQKNACQFVSVSDVCQITYAVAFCVRCVSGFDACADLRRRSSPFPEVTHSPCLPRRLAVR
jgi:hypothetical protein